MDPNREPLRKIPVVAVPEISQDIGSSLKSRREAKGRSLDAVSQQTRIPKRFLEALEKNQLDEFPALVYLRGFLKSYCEYLELDFEPLWSQIQPPAAPTEASEAPAQSVKPAAAPAPGEANSPMPALILAAALVLGTIFIMRKPAPEKTSALAEAPAALAPYSALDHRLLTINYLKDAWISLRSDDVLLFEGRVPQGARQEWKARKAFSLRTPQPQNLEITLDTTPYRLPAEQPQGTYKIE